MRHGGYRQKRWLVVFAMLAVAACAPADGDPATGAGAGLADIPIAGERVFPESITSDRAGNIYAGSSSGIIYRARAGDDVAAPWIKPDEANGLNAVYGVFADDKRSLLWVCSNRDMFSDNSDQPDPALKAFDLATGALVGSHPFPKGKPVACNDIAIAGDGLTFATETLAGRIFTLSAPGEDLALFAEADELVGIDGIAFADDGTLYINNVRRNLVQRVERHGNGAYAGVTDLALSQPVEGPDGLRAVGGNRFLQAEGMGGRIALLTIDGDHVDVEPVVEGMKSTASVTRVGPVGYTAEGKIEYLVDPALKGRDPGRFVIRAFALPAGD